MSTAAQPRVILVVDNDHGTRVRLRTLLESAGYEVFTATDGNMALIMMRRLTVLPRLVLLDPMMPIMDGWEFLEAKRAEPAWEAVSVVMHARLSDGEILELARRAWSA